MLRIRPGAVVFDDRRRGRRVRRIDTNAQAHLGEKLLEVAAPQPHGRFVEEIAIVKTHDGHARRPRARDDAVRRECRLLDATARVREQLVERDHPIAVEVGTARGDAIGQ